MGQLYFTLHTFRLQDDIYHGPRYYIHQSSTEALELANLFLAHFWPPGVDIPSIFLLLACVRLQRQVT